MHTPPWLLNILVSYLSDRSMVLEYNGNYSTRKKVLGGGPQGAYLGGLIFIVKYNGAFLRPPVPWNIEVPPAKSNSKSVKFVDDGNVAVSINLKSSLVPDKRKKPQPLNYDKRTCQVLPKEQNLLQYYLEDAEKFTEENR